MPAAKFAKPNACSSPTAATLAFARQPAHTRDRRNPKLHLASHISPFARALHAPVECTPCSGHRDLARCPITHSALTRLRAYSNLALPAPFLPPYQRAPSRPWLTRVCMPSAAFASTVNGWRAGQFIFVTLTGVKAAASRSTWD